MTYPDQLTIETALKAQRWPPRLILATKEGGNYLIELSTGRTIMFEHAVDLGNGWVAVGDETKDEEVRVDAIVAAWSR
jgi:hypothetical protein